MPRVSRWGLLVGLAVAAGVVLRVVVYRSAVGNTNSDEALLGLMVIHALHGHLAVFQWAQPYGGTQEVLLTVPIFWLAGPSLLGLRAVPLILDAVASILVWRVGRRTIGERPAVVAALLLWLWPPRAISDTVHAWGFYGSDLVYCSLVLLLVLRAEERPDAIRVGLIGLVSGLALWQTFQIVPIIVPAIAWLVWRQRRALRYAWLAVGLGIVGALPALVWNVHHGWGSLHITPDANFSYSHRLRIFLSPIFPEFLGLRAAYSQLWVGPGAIGWVLYAGLVALFGYGAYRARHSDKLLLYLVVGVFPVLYAISPKADQPTDPRYAMVIAPCLVLLFAELARGYAAAVALLAVALLVSSVGLHREDTWLSHLDSPNGFYTPRSIAPLVSTLDRLGVRRVFTNYWVAYRLDFATRERIVAVENGFEWVRFHDGDVWPIPDPRVRYPPYGREVRSGRHAFVFIRRLPPPAADLRILAQHGYTAHDVQDFVVYAPPAAG
jgi:hypothetical protein